MGWRSSPKRRTVVAGHVRIAVMAKGVTPEAIALLLETVVTMVVIVSVF